MNVLKLSRFLVRGLFWLNILAGAGFVAVLAWWAVSPDVILTAVGTKYGIDQAPMVLNFMRLALILGAVAAIPVGLLLALLSRMIDTVGQGTPFITANAVRLRKMAWLILGFQLLDLLGGLLSFYAQKNDIDWIGWSPSLLGWLLVLLLFILAGIFEQGVAMRDDLEGTV
ncbi:DUF2975 domain-containing protein [Stakelama pacifica]|uniref:DUF2975 family protein n=1 Tax=Stakelama pacifica TaxID=517720 RepID=A0A4R6FUH2_9SPHN|nr:DUF2975 domain-containing protein [Stakelama pacifica]TDN85422.1 DUF2975 family protein [Stakelama pacifica]GGO92692.1 hypothetical protein GCM10011329_10390 [Stakelama pacifica]